ncbi:MAG TPA: NAD-dependent epimerase/dehydratase family protein [Cytophagaceae bacterium]|jgi:UDP-glucose 4-epimerase|nr:NAD-dependent epimerase/dehydratase family protein [Cytophagaceae bacterium]
MNVSLVTGGAGFIGAHVVRELLVLKHKVVVLDDLSGGFEENLPEGVIFVKGTILDHELINSLFEQHRFNYVYHLAAYAAEGLSHFIKRFNYNNNLIGSVNLINASIQYKVKCFVFTSSIATYGALPPPMKESMTPCPEDPYGIAKYAVEMDLKTSHEMFGLDYVIFRPHNVYGEYQNLGDKYRNVVGIFMNQLMQDKPLTIFGDGSQTRAFSYIGDVAPHIANAVNIPAAYNQTFNIGADKDYSVSELAKAVMRAMGKTGMVRHVEARNEVLHAYADHSKAHQVFGSELKFDLDTGLSKMAEWAKKTGIKRSVKFENIEILEKLPPVWLE